MLQLKQISKVLCQGLAPVGGDSIELNNSVLSICLLSSDGIALTTVVNSSLLSELNISNDDLKIYSLMGYNHLQHQLKTFYSKYAQTSADKPPPEVDASLQELAGWTIVKLQNNLKLIIQKLSHDASLVAPLYVSIFFHSQFPDELAKLKIDNLTTVLSNGLSDYTG